MAESSLIDSYNVALHVATRRNAVSEEAAAVREQALAFLAAKELVSPLLSPKSAVIARIHEVASEGVGGEESMPVSPSVIERAVNFIRALPPDLALPDVGADPDGSIAFDWIVTRARVFSVSVGATNRLAFAWIDGTDRGHGVERFDGDAVPSRVLAGIREIIDARAAALRTA
jgi:hypothetical protein